MALSHATKYALLISLPLLGSFAFLALLCCWKCFDNAFTKACKSICCCCFKGKDEYDYNYNNNQVLSKYRIVNVLRGEERNKTEMKP